MAPMFVASHTKSFTAGRSRPGTYALAALLCAAALLVMSAPVHAQTDAVQQHTEKSAQDSPKENTTSLAASLGGTLNTGNTQAWQLIAGSDLLIVRDPHSVTGMVAFAYGEANIPSNTSDGFEATVKNLRARGRYDYFLTRMDALFVAAAFRWDEFAGLDSRIQGQLGYLRYFLRTDNHRFWGEAGYDITRDDFHPLPNPDFMIDPDTDEPVDPSIPEFTSDGTQVVHSARLFLGYDNRLTETLTYLGGLEGLVNVEEPKDTRINMDNALRSKLGGNFSLEIKFSLQFDNVPVPGAKKLDTQTVGTIIYNLI
jgi:putative salt-induced outer membrane protein YdiY